MTTTTYTMGNEQIMTDDDQPNEVAQWVDEIDPETGKIIFSLMFCTHRETTEIHAMTYPRNGKDGTVHKSLLRHDGAPLSRAWLRERHYPMHSQLFAPAHS